MRHFCYRCKYRKGTKEDYFCGAPNGCVRDTEIKALPCPFCGKRPIVNESNVICINPECPTWRKPFERGVIVYDGETSMDSRGEDAYRAIAITRWNTRKQIKCR